MVKRRTRSILEEISRIDINKDKDHFIESKAKNIIAFDFSKEMLKKAKEKITNNKFDTSIINCC